MAVRDQLLESADRLFYARGITATGVDTISADARAGKMSLYHHFGSKDGLVAAYLTGRDEQWQAHLDRRLAAAGADPVARLHALAAAYEDRVADPAYRGCSFLNAAAELPAEHPARRVVTAHKQRIREQLRRYLAEAGGAEPGGAAAGVAAADAQAAHLFALLEGILAMAAVDPAGADVAHARQQAHRLIDASAARVNPARRQHR